jgi:NAD(P)H-hydrate epimerase
MTIGGTGDVLAGLAAGLLAQSKDLFNSAYHAAQLNGKIGDHLLETKGVGFTASDMIDLIPEIKKKLKI